MSGVEAEQLASPDPSTTAWVPLWSLGPSSTPVPPVVNGQWLKGVGGAAVWQPIADADLPPRLVGQGITDCNTAVASGWYVCQPGTANAPTTSYFEFQTVALNAANGRQIAYDYATDTVWMRKLKDGAWNGWLPTWPPKKFSISGLVIYDGSVYYGSGYTCVRTSVGNYTITLTTPMTWPVPIATPQGQSLVIGANAVSASVVNIYITTPSQWSDSTFSFVIFDSVYDTV